MLRTSNGLWSGIFGRMREAAMGIYRAWFRCAKEKDTVEVKSGGG